MLTPRECEQLVSDFFFPSGLHDTLSLHHFRSSFALRPRAAAHPGREGEGNIAGGEGQAAPSHYSGQGRRPEQGGERRAAECEGPSSCDELVEKVGQRLCVSALSTFAILAADNALFIPGCLSGPLVDIRNTRDATTRLAEARALPLAFPLPIPSQASTVAPPRSHARSHTPVQACTRAHTCTHASSREHTDDFARARECADAAAADTC